MPLKSVAVGRGLRTSAGIGVGVGTGVGVGAGAGGGGGGGGFGQAVKNPMAAAKTKTESPCLTARFFIPAQVCAMNAE